MMRKKKLVREHCPSLIDSNIQIAKGPLVAETLSETNAATSHWANQTSNEDLENMMRDAAVARHASMVKFLENKLAIAKGKITKAEMTLWKVPEKLKRNGLPNDLETITDEEGFLFRKMGLSMKPYLVLGSRGVFDGVIEKRKMIKSTTLCTTHGKWQKQPCPMCRHIKDKTVFAISHV